MTLRTVLLLAIVWMALMGCAEKLICPAYQSTFIHDKDALRKKFSYFENDSTPRVFTASASKNKYLIAEPESYRKRYRKMQTISLKPIQTMVPDSLTEDGLLAELDSAARTVIDSIGTPKIDSLSQAKLDSAKSADSTYVITKDREVRVLRYNFPDSLHYDSATKRYRKEMPKYYVEEVRYNGEQELYMWYFRKQLILPDVRLSKMTEGNKAKEAAKKKQKGGFFKRLMFWKKDKKKIQQDSLQIAPPPIDPHDSIFYTDSANLKPKQPVSEPKKKGIKGLLRKKEKPVTTDPNKSPAKKEEEDGF